MDERTRDDRFARTILKIKMDDEKNEGRKDDLNGSQGMGEADAVFSHNYKIPREVFCIVRQ